MTPRRLLALEGIAVFALSVYFYFERGGAWWLFLLLLLAPDLSAAGYLFSIRIGSITYNAVHIYVWPLLLGAFAVHQGEALLLQLALIWSAHIGMDRMLGYGLKYTTRFQDTHLQHV